MTSKVIFGDCLEVMGNLPPQSVDMVLCDLPYGVTKCKWDNKLNLMSLWECYEAIVKPNCAIVLTSKQPFTTELIHSKQSLFKYCMVWEKSKATGFLNAKRRPLEAHEDIVVFSKGLPPYYPQMQTGGKYNKGVRKEQTTEDVYGKFDRKLVSSSGGRYPRSVVYFKTAESEGKTFHKTQKPIALFEYLIKTYTNEGALILDNCAGSGTTGLAALNTNRRYCLIEKDPFCIDIINSRLQSKLTA